MFGYLNGIEIISFVFGKDRKGLSCELYYIRYLLVPVTLNALERILALPGVLSSCGNYYSLGTDKLNFRGAD